MSYLLIGILGFLTDHPVLGVISLICGFVASGIKGKIKYRQ